MSELLHFRLSHCSPTISSPFQWFKSDVLIVVEAHALSGLRLTYACRSDRWRCHTSACADTFPPQGALIVHSPCLFTVPLSLYFAHNSFSFDESLPTSFQFFVVLNMVLPRDETYVHGRLESRMTGCQSAEAQLLSGCPFVSACYRNSDITGT